MSQTIYLTQYGLMAKRHWTEFLPKMVKQLEAEGRLEEALFEAQQTTLDELLTLEDELVAQGLTMDQACRQAWELIREKYILLPPEEND